VVGERENLSDDIADNEFFDDNNIEIGGKQYRTGEKTGLQDSPFLHPKSLRVIQGGGCHRPRS